MTRRLTSISVAARTLPSDVLTALAASLRITKQASGLEILSRDAVSVATVATVTQRLQLTYFTAPETRDYTQARFSVGSTAAAATPSLARVGLYSVDADGDITLIASCASDTSLFDTTNAQETVTFSAAVSLVAGERYAVGVLVVNAGACPVFYGSSGLLAADAAVAPRLAGQVTGQADLPATVAAGSVANTGSRIYAVLL